MALIKISASLHLLVAFCLLNTIMILANAEVDISNTSVVNTQTQLFPEFINLFQTRYKTKCIEVAGKEKGEEAYQAIEAAKVNLVECLSNIINYTAIQEKISLAKAHKTYYEYHEYCPKSSEAYACIGSFYIKLSPCQTPEEKEKEVEMRIVRSILNFICEDSVMIDFFIAEEGLKCLELKQDVIIQCIDNNFLLYLPNEDIENDNFQGKFVRDSKQCKKIEELEACVVSTLDTCEDVSPAIIVETIFRFVKNAFCKVTEYANTNRTFQTERKTSSSGAVQTSLLDMPLLSIGLMFYYLRVHH